MNRTTFAAGFGASVVLLSICCAYAFSPAWSTNFALYFAKDGGYVGSPEAFRYSLLAFALLNIPAVIVGSGVMYALDVVYTPNSLSCHAWLCVLHPCRCVRAPAA